MAEMNMGKVLGGLFGVMMALAVLTIVPGMLIQYGGVEYPEGYAEIESVQVSFG